MSDIERRELDADFYRILVEESEEGIWVVDREYRVRYANGKLADLLGLPSPDGVIGQSYFDFVAPEYHATLRNEVAQRMQGQRGTYELRLLRQGGGSQWVEISAFPLFDESRMFLGAAGFVADIEWRKAAEQRLSDSERAYREVFDCSPAIKLMVDPSTGEIVAANASAKAYYGYTDEEFRQLNISQINTQPRQMTDQDMAHAQRMGGTTFRFKHRLKSGEIRDVEVQVNPILLGARPLLYSIIRDVGNESDAARRLRMLQFTVEQAHIAAIWLNRDGTIRDLNEYAVRLIKQAREAIVGQPIWQFDPNMDAATWALYWHAIQEQGAMSFRAGLLVEGEYLPVQVHSTYLATDGDEFVISYARDIVEQVHGEGLLALQNDVLSALARGKDLSQVLSMLAEGVEDLAPGALCSILLLQDGTLLHGAAPTLPEGFQRVVDGRKIGPAVGSCGTAAFLDDEVEVVDIETDPLWTDYKSVALAYDLRACWSTPIHARDGRVLGTFAIYYRQPMAPLPFHRRVVKVCTPIAGLAIEHHFTEARVHALAFYDALTGLPNRALLADRVDVALARSKRDRVPLALLFLDLDRFKTINDSLGHEVGDAFLSIIAARLAAEVRQCDTVCRQGGDEFVVLLPDIDAVGAAVVAEKLIATAVRVVDLVDHQLSCSVSIGISIYPDDASDFATLLKHADTAMYRAKEAGRNGYRLYRDRMDEDTTERLDLENELRRAISADELFLHYQPQVVIEDGSLYGLEALLRWRHPTRGLVSPARFIPVAEESGLIDAIGAWVLDEACRQMAEWIAQGVPIPRLAINLSARQFRHEDVPNLVVETLTRHQLPADRVTLEITESLMLNEDATAQSLVTLDAMGVHLAVDDFGTGYSSLGYLKRFPVKELKLDQSFVRDLGDDPDDRALASAVIRIGQSLRMTVVAEGVETPEQLEYLRQEGCHVAQGYLFARPMPAEDLLHWLATQTMLVEDDFTSLD